MADDFKDEIRSRMGESAVDVVERRLDEWGVTGLNSFETNDVTNVDFNTPLPGKQPIRSSLTISDEGVTEATIRYGTFNPDTFDSHPADPQDPAMQRLKRVVEQVPYDGSLPINVDFGDAGRSPRPHLRTAVSRGGNMAERAANPATVHSGEGERGEPADPVAFVDYIIRVGEAIAAEYDDEFSTPVPGMANPPQFVVDFIDRVDEKWDVESAAPASVTETEVELEATTKEARVVFNPDGEVVRMSVTAIPSPLADWDVVISDAGWPEEATTTQRGGKRITKWDGARTDETLRLKDAARMLRNVELYG